MRPYCMHLCDQSNKITSREEVMASFDEQAVELALRLEHRHFIDRWEGRRHVRLIEPRERCSTDREQAL